MNQEVVDGRVLGDKLLHSVCDITNPDVLDYLLALDERNVGNLLGPYCLCCHLVSMRVSTVVFIQQAQMV